MQKLDDNPLDIDNFEDCKRIQKVMLAHGWWVTLPEAAELWCNHSDDLAAGWLFLPDDDDDIWASLRSQLPE